MYKVRERERKIILPVVLIALDQLTKLLALQRGIAVINNKGATFGIIFAGILAYIYFFKKQDNLGILLILAGGVSNLIDRVFYGGVVDFVSLPLISVFNLADLMICAGIGLFFIDTLRKTKV